MDLLAPVDGFVHAPFADVRYCHWYTPAFRASTVKDITVPVETDWLSGWLMMCGLHSSSSARVPLIVALPFAVDTVMSDATFFGVPIRCANTTILRVVVDIRGAVINGKTKRAQFADVGAIIPNADFAADPVGCFRWCLSGCVGIAAKVNAELADIETGSVGSCDTPGNAAGDAAGILVPGLNVVGFAGVDGHTGTGDIRVGAAAAFPALERYSSNRAVPSGSPRSLSAHADRFIIAAQAGHVVPGAVLCGQAKTCADVSGIRVIAGRGQAGGDDVVYSPCRHRCLVKCGVGNIKICGACA